MVLISYFWVGIKLKIFNLNPFNKCIAKFCTSYTIYCPFVKILLHSLVAISKGLIKKPVNKAVVHMNVLRMSKTTTQNGAKPILHC